MHPVLFDVGGVSVASYGVFVLLAFVVGGWVRSREKRRLGFASDERHRWVALGALVGAVIGAKLGMLLFTSSDAFLLSLTRMGALDFTGKTVIGGLAGGYLGVEAAKKLVGIDYSTGDSFALAVPLAQAIGRIGCFLHGCCFGTPHEGPLAVTMHGAARHPTQLYEAGLLLVLVAVLARVRTRSWPSGTLFRLYIVGYAVIRFWLEFVRGDPGRSAFGLSFVQWVCLAAALGFGVLVYRSLRSASADGERPSDVSPSGAER